MSSNIRKFPNFPRSVRPLPEPLGLYLRAGYNDHKTLLDLTVRGDTSYCGVVFDPTKQERHTELREQILKQKLDAILDPKTLQSATPGGFGEAMGALPWGVGGQHTQEDFKDTAGRRLIGSLAEFVCEREFTQVISPTHLITTDDDPWLMIDVESTTRLRTHLDHRSGNAVPIIYQLAISYRAFRDRAQRKWVNEAGDRVGPDTRNIATPAFS